MVASSPDGVVPGFEATNGIVKRYVSEVASGVPRADGKQAVFKARMDGTKAEDVLGRKCKGY